jgi:hypothetical protein
LEPILIAMCVLTNKLLLSDNESRKYFLGL